MVHPCRTGIDDKRTVLHACATTTSTTTLCGVALGGEAVINVTAGYDTICRRCFPRNPHDPGADDVDMGDK